MNERLSHILRFAVSWAAQVGLFQYIGMTNGWGIPAVHLYALLLLPLRLHPTSYLLIGGSMGLAMDWGTMGGGLYTSAGLLFGFLQPVIARLLGPREGYEQKAKADWREQGGVWFAWYGLILVGSHELWLRAWEAGRWNLLGEASARAVVSTAVTVLFFALIIGLRGAKNRRR
jgi:hypothetical protein